MPMAIFGAFSTVRAQVAGDVRFAAAVDYVADLLAEGSVARQRIGRLLAGVTERFELPGGAFALEQVYRPKARSEGFFESHRKFIDVQVIVEGEEQMEVGDVARLVVTEPYHAERDFIKYADTAEASVLRLRAGDVAVFFPDDGHMPSLHWRGGGLVRKSVVKVPVE